jgi:hypothetical protein
VALDWYFLLVKLIRQPRERQHVRAGGLRAMIEVIGTAAKYPKKLVVAALQGTEIWQLTKVPFADERCAVAYLFEQ